MSVPYSRQAGGPSEGAVFLELLKPPWHKQYQQLMLMLYSTLMY